MSNSTQSSARDKVRATITESIDVLCNAVERERASELFQRYLETQAKFHKYSWNNAMLILSQCPEASRVAGYKTWQKLNRQVRKGEKGIRIIAPCPWKRESGDGETESGVFFRVVSVFDVSQTDGEALPTIHVETVADQADELLARLESVAKSKSIDVEFKALTGAYGASKRGTIEIDPKWPTGQQAKTLAHEIAHELLHWDIKGPVTRNFAEMEAESVAYVVARHFGIDCEVRSARYIALFQGDEKGIRESLKRISDTAKTIIDGIDSVVTANEKAVAA